MPHLLFSLAHNILVKEWHPSNTQANLVINYAPGKKTEYM